jgi:hypothetical protein
MQDVLRALNQLVDARVIEAYAIGGAMGAAFYIDAVQTEDVDAFTYFPQASSGLLDLSPIYSALLALGGKLEREYVRFGAWPLQILPDSTPLVSEAIRDARAVEFEGIPTRVFMPEHLCCIALQTGRAKDFLRVQMFLEQGQVDLAGLRRMAERFGLGDRLVKAEALSNGTS